MHSPSKQLDQELLLAINDMITTLIKLGTTESIYLAEEYYDTYQKISAKLATFNYDNEDAHLEAFNSIINKQ